MTDKKNKCVFFDRDNTLIYDKGYIFKKKDLKWKSGVIRTIKLLNKLKFLVIVITNQSGVARKYFTENGILAFPTDSIPHSKFLLFILDFLLGPNFPERNIMPTTKPTASINCIRIGK
jgi:histidinol phosphatase-like enzyme